ncbi:MAG: hypothetical protein WAU11_00685 [Ignavibacteriaceae bacterium]
MSTEASAWHFQKWKMGTEGSAGHFQKWKMGIEASAAYFQKWKCKSLILLKNKRKCKISGQTKLAGWKIGFERFEWI